MKVLEPIAEQLRALRSQGHSGGEDKLSEAELEALTGRHHELSLKLYGTRLLLGRLLDADLILQQGILYCTIYQ